MIKLKQKGVLKEKFKTESWGKIAIWSDGSWVDVGTGYGGEQDGNNPKLYLSRPYFYDTTQAERRRMIRAIERALNEDGSILFIYEELCWREEER